VWWRAAAHRHSKGRRRGWQLEERVVLMAVGQQADNRAQPRSETQDIYCHRLPSLYYLDVTYMVPGRWKELAPPGILSAVLMHGAADRGSP